MVQTVFEDFERSSPLADYDTVQGSNSISTTAYAGDHSLAQTDSDSNIGTLSHPNDAAFPERGDRIFFYMRFADAGAD